MTLSEAMHEWETILGTEGVWHTERAHTFYGMTTAGTSWSVLGALFPCDVRQVAQCVLIARQHKVPLYPISRGRNWGYGCSLPARPGCVVLDLNRMRRIIQVDESSDTVTLEPGVTQGELRAYLDEHRLPYMVPTTGAGPGGSLVGNALDRGFGITPHADHWDAVTAIEAVLPDGSIYRSPLWAKGCTDIARVFKWGVGPYLDGLFAQSGFGVVTAATLRLARLPEQVTGFAFDVPSDQQLEQAVAAIRQVQRSCGANLGGINLMSGLRMLAMFGKFPRDACGGVVPIRLNTFSTPPSLSPGLVAAQFTGRNESFAQFAVRFVAA